MYNNLITDIYGIGTIISRTILPFQETIICEYLKFLGVIPGYYINLLWRKELGEFISGLYRIA
jgi:hypothetical protein